MYWDSVKVKPEPRYCLFVRFKDDGPGASICAHPISHPLSAAASDKTVSTSSRLVTVLDRLSKYADTR